MATNFRVQTDEAGVMTVTFDMPDKPVNTITPKMLDELDAWLDEVEKSPPKGVVFASAKKSVFIAGADIEQMSAMDRSTKLAFLAHGQRVFDRIERLGMPTVAAINGHCLGGGLELALACRFRVAADQEKLTIGLPEVLLGLIPGWGGTVRLPRLIGVEKALELITAGKTLPVKDALAAGIVDEAVPPGELDSAARKMLKAPRPSRVNSAGDGTVDAVCDGALARVEANPNPACRRAVETVWIGFRNGIAAGLEAERHGLVELADGEVSKRMIREFFEKRKK